VDFAARNAAHGFGRGQIFRADSILFTKRVAFGFSLLVQSKWQAIIVFFTLSIPIKIRVTRNETLSNKSKFDTEQYCPASNLSIYTRQKQPRITLDRFDT